MPIRPENRARYPKNWKGEILPAVRKRSRNRCECTGQCGLTHTGKGGRCTARNGKPHPVTGAKVVLTVMHLNHTPEDCAPANLLHGCQQCHNRYDAPHRRAGIKSRAHQARASGDLFENCSRSSIGLEHQISTLMAAGSSPAGNAKQTQRQKRKFGRQGER